jgi:hypothetical protein
MCSEPLGFEDVVLGLGGIGLGFVEAGILLKVLLPLGFDGLVLVDAFGHGGVYLS